MDNSPVDFSICIAHRGDPMGLWATIHSCEIELAGSPYKYEYCLCLNGESSSPKLTKTSPVHYDTFRLLNHFNASGKLGYVKILQRSVSPPTARQLATAKAKGEVLFFFDNHVLVDKGYFDKALRHFPAVDMVHSTTRFFVGDITCYEYKLTLDKNFWAGASLTAASPNPYAIAAGGHGGFAVLASTWREVGGYWEGFNGYGGEEMYFDLKMAMLDKTNIIDPELIHFHYAGKRPYSRHYTDDYFRNMMMCANIIGGEDWMYKVFNNFLEMPINKTPMYELLMQAHQRSAPHAAWLRTKQHRSLDEQLALFDRLSIPH